MKTINYIFGIVAAAATMTACVGDLNVTPIDPNANTVDKVLVSQSALDSYIAGVYLGFATSGYYGPDGGASISGLDGGASQYIRGLYHLNELTTDESVCGWNDQTIKNFHYMNWTKDDTFIYAFYSRVLMQVSTANEFIREAGMINGIDEAVRDRYIDEARALRALAYYHGLDNFGKMPFTTEADVVGVSPKEISRANLFTWLETELKDIMEAGRLPGKDAVRKGHVSMGFVKFLLAKLYLNAEVYTGTARWQDCANVLKDLMDDGYSLHTTSVGGKYSAYQELFLADNDQRTDEIIFAVEQDGEFTKSYGVTNYLIFASTGGTMDVTQIGISSGWGGLRTTPEFVSLFDKVKDDRYLLYDTDKSTADVDKMPEKTDKEKKAKDAARENVQKLDIDDIGNFADGYGFQKFLNKTSAGEDGKAAGFVDTDFPLMRYADVLLMAAECQMNGATGLDGLGALNQVRARAGLPAANGIAAQDLLDERGRELYQECWRRNDLIRFDKFVSGYTWQWKGEVKEGRDAESYRTLFPIPTQDLQANTNLTQNEGYL